MKLRWLVTMTLLVQGCAHAPAPAPAATPPARGAVSEDTVVFTFVDVTNRSPEQAMLVERTLRIAQDAFEDTEVYRGADGREERTTYRFVRAAAHGVGSAGAPHDIVVM